MIVVWMQREPWVLVANMDEDICVVFKDVCDGTSLYMIVHMISDFLGLLVIQTTDFSRRMIARQQRDRWSES